MAKAEQQAINFFNNKQDADLAVLLHSQPSAAGAAHLSLQRLADAGMAMAYTALLQSEMTTQQDGPAADASPALALHNLISSMTEKNVPFITDVIAAMRAAGISLNSTNLDKDTPLHLAARTGQLQLCQLLIQYGADPLARNIRNRWGHMWCNASCCLWHFRHEGLCRTPSGQAKLATEVKSFLADQETLAKDQRQFQKNSVWDEKMKATQTQSAYGVRCL